MDKMGCLNGQDELWVHGSWSTAMQAYLHWVLLRHGKASKS
jgi:hypothetical protein